MHVTAKHLHDTDLLGTLVNGHHHRIGNTDCRHKQGNRTDAAEDRLYHLVLLLRILDPFHITVRLIAQILNLLLHLGHMLRAVHVHNNMIIVKLLIRFSRSRCRLSRNRFVLEHLL